MRRIFLVALFAVIGACASTRSAFAQASVFISPPISISVPYTNAKMSPYNALGTARTTGDAVTTSGSATITSATATFTAADVGAYVSISGDVSGTQAATESCAQVSSVTNSTTAVLNTPASGSLTAGFMVIGPNDEPALQSWVNSVTAGYLPTGNYLMCSNAPLSVSKSISILGDGAYPVRGTLSAQGAENVSFCPCLFPYMTGSVLIQGASSQDAINIPSASITPNFDHFGILFANMFASPTGNGINSVPPVDGGGNDIGVIQARWDSLIVEGYDGNHYGYALQNPLVCELDNDQAYGGGALYIYGNAPSFNAGNCNVSLLSGALVAGGSAHNIYLHATQSNGLNIFQFNRVSVSSSNVLNQIPQFEGVPTPTASQYIFLCDSTIPYVRMLQMDLESHITTGYGGTQPCVGNSSYDYNGSDVQGLSSSLNLTTTPASGTVYQNLSGQAQLYFLGAAMNPTGSAAATVTGVIGPTGSPATTMCSLSEAATNVTGSIRECTMFIPPSWYFKFTFTNATLSFGQGTRVN